MAPRSSLVHGGGTVATDGSSMYDGGIFDATILAKADVDVDMLKSQISKYAYGDKGRCTPDMQPFKAVFEQEMHRVMKVVDLQQNNLEFSAKSLLTNAEVMLEQVSQCTLNGHNMIHDLSQKMEDLVLSCLELQNFVTKNRSALLTVAQKADTQLKTQCTDLVESSFQSNINSVLVVVVSDTYAAIRSAEKKLNSQNSAGEEDGVWKAPSSFQRSTTKYWVKEEQLTKLLLSCAGEAPLLVYGKKGTLTPKSDRLTRVSEGDKLWDSMVTPITSVYFDAPDMSMYKKRLARLEGAELLRARWYGPTMPKGDGIIFLELKTHHEKWVTNQSVKERAAVHENDMSAFLQPIPWSAKEAEEMILRASPQLKGDELNEASNLLYRMHRLVVKHKLRSCIRSVYMRAAFQSAKSNDLRLTLDRTVTLIDETGHANTLSKGWCLSDDEAKQTAKAVVVPYNVFEIKLVGENPMPQGLATLISSGVIEEAPKFSKFLTGAAAFNRVATLPYWANHPSFAPMYGVRQAQQSEDAQQYTSLLDPCDCYHLFGCDPTPGDPSGANKRNLIDKFLNPKVGSADGAAVKIAEKKPVRAEPKSFFANERTFIQWVSAALLLLTVSTIMMGNGNYMHTAALISFSALLLVVYATFVYFRRIKLLTTGKGHGYIDHVGPVVLAAGVGTGVFIVFWDIMGATDVLGEAENWEGKGARRLFSFNPHRLLASGTHNTAMYEDPGNCIRQSIFGINALTYEPNDVIVDLGKQSLLVASTAEILMHPFEGGEASHLVHLHDTELGGLTTVGDRIFALSGGPQATELLEFAWNQFGTLEQQGSWMVMQSATEIDGLAFVPNGNDQEGQLYMGFGGSMFSYQVPSRSDASLSRTERFNMKLIGQGLSNHQGKFSSMQYFEGVTYLLHATSGVVHAWDMGTGEFLATIALPHLDNGLSDEWKGFALERRSIQQDDGTASLRGSQASSELLVHLTLEAPPQIWTFAVEEVESRGGFTFPECAGASAMSSN